MSAIIARLKKFLRRSLGWLNPIAAALVEPADNEPKTAIAVPKAPRSAAQGDFRFKRAVLDQLDNYFDVLKRMRRADPAAYALYSKLGAHLLPDFSLARETTLSPWWRANRPSFGAVAICLDPKTRALEEQEGILYPRFLYFTKFKATSAPPNVQRCNSGDIYIVTIYWDDKSLGGLPTQFPVSINAEGAVRALRTLRSESVPLRGKRGVGRGQSYTIPRRAWGHDPFFKRLPGCTSGIEAFLVETFVFAAASFEAANTSMIRVDIESGALHAVFGVDILRTPYFFSDRDVALTPNGRRRRIFHIVRTHQRIDGGFVRSHFRGERSFAWNGFQVRITVPGRDHANLVDLDAALIDPTQEKSVGKAFVTVGQMATRVRQGIDRSAAAGAA